MTCCILHNLLLTHDGLDDKWDDRVDDVEMDEDEMQHISNFHLRVADLLRTNAPDRSRIGVHYFNCNTALALESNTTTNTEVIETDMSNYELQQHLSEHFQYLFMNNKIAWRK